MKYIRVIGPILAITIPYLFFELLRNGIIHDPYIQSPSGHFYIVSVVAFLATIIAIAIGIAGKRLRNIKISFLALSFISLALMFSVHGISTPSFLLPATKVTSISAQLSMILASVWLWLSSLPSDHRWVTFFSSRQSILLPAWIAVLLSFSFISLLFPHLFDFLPSNKSILGGIATGAIIVLNAVTIYHYYQSYRFSRFPLQIAIVYSAGWFMVTQLIMVLGELWKLSWWMYHFVLLAAMIVMIIGIVQQYATKSTWIGSMRGLFTTDPFERITSSVSAGVRKLVLATEKKDQYTAGHSFRVTMYALQLAEEMGLSPEDLRALAQGGLLHDVGKIKISREVLNKPGRLTAEEREEIEMHPVHGYEMCRNLGLLKEELGIIRSHHEKWDGTGYPDQLKGLEIPLLARIVAVADVYDALTSDRSYRRAWPHEDAMKLLIEQKGIHFDPDCVDAWVRLCKRDPSVYQYPAELFKMDTTQSFLSL